MIIIRNVRLIDGTGKKPVEKASIVIKDGKIRDAGTDCRIPYGETVIDGEGLTAIPGLIDMHTHFGGSFTFDRPSIGSRFETYDYVKAREGFLNWGVTTVRTCGDRADDILSYRDDVNAGKITSPRVISCGPFIQNPEGHPWATVFFRDEEAKDEAFVFVDTDAPIEEQVDRIAEKGVDFIKVFYGHLDVLHYPAASPRMTEEQLKRVIDRAHSHGLKCACHVDGPDEMHAAAKAGADTVEHMINAGNTGSLEFTDEIVEAIKETGAVIDPTLIATVRAQNPEMPDVVGPAMRGVKKLYDAGVTLAAGCDSGIPFVPFGESLHDELACLAQAGIPNAEILKMATSGNAVILGMADRIGSIEPGKEADLVLIAGDPLKDISATKNIRLVMRQGRIVREAL